MMTLSTSDTFLKFFMMPENEGLLNELVAVALGQTGEVSVTNKLQKYIKSTGRCNNAISCTIEVSLKGTKDAYIYLEEKKNDISVVIISQKQPLSDKTILCASEVADINIDYNTSKLSAIDKLSLWGKLICSKEVNELSQFREYGYEPVRIAAEHLLTLEADK